VPARDPATLDAFLSLRVGLAQLPGGERGRVLLVTSPVAREGKSTVALGLALAAARSERVLLVEADLRAPVQAARLGLGPGPGLADLLSGDAPVAAVLRSIAVEHVGATAGLTCVPAGSATPWAPELIRSQRLRSFLADAREEYDLIVIDSAPLLAVAEAAELMPLTDVVALCARVGAADASEVRACRETLARLPPRPTALVLTAVPVAEAIAGARSGGRPTLAGVPG
jgi:Mrp family chromosome partitioning ATPase